MLRVARNTAVKSRRVALQMLRAQIVSAPEELRDQVRNLTRMQLIRTCAAWRPDATGFRDPVVTYRLTRRDKAVLGRGLSRLALVLLEAGATDVYPSYRGAPVVRTPSDLATVEATFAVGRASVMTVHLCSTVPFGEIETSATDSVGLVRGTTNVRVHDASLLPDAPGVNPQASVMAVAIRNTRRFVETLTPGRKAVT